MSEIVRPETVIFENFLLSPLGFFGIIGPANAGKTPFLTIFWPTFRCGAKAFTGATWAQKETLIIGPANAFFWNLATFSYRTPFNFLAKNPLFIDLERASWPIFLNFGPKIQKCDMGPRLFSRNAPEIAGLYISTRPVLSCEINIEKCKKSSSINPHVCFAREIFCQLYYFYKIVKNERSAYI